MNFCRAFLGCLGYGFFVLLSAILVGPYMAFAYLVFLKENLNNTCDWVGDPTIKLGLFDYLNERSKEKYCE